MYFLLLVNNSFSFSNEEANDLLNSLEKKTKLEANIGRPTEYLIDRENDIIDEFYTEKQIDEIDKELDDKYYKMLNYLKK
jgi:hypothetical protein